METKTQLLTRMASTLERCSEWSEVVERTTEWFILGHITVDDAIALGVAWNERAAESRAEAREHGAGIVAGILTEEWLAEMRRER